MADILSRSSPRSDRQSILIIDTLSKQQVDQELVDVKFCWALTWLGDEVRCRRDPLLAWLADCPLSCQGLRVQACPSKAPRRPLWYVYFPCAMPLLLNFPVSSRGGL